MIIVIFGDHKVDLLLFKVIINYISLLASTANIMDLPFCNRNKNKTVYDLGCTLYMISELHGNLLKPHFPNNFFVVLY